MSSTNGTPELYVIVRSAHERNASVVDRSVLPEVYATPEAAESRVFELMTDREPPFSWNNYTTTWYSVYTMAQYSA